MASSSRTVRVRFDGDTDGLNAAAAEATSTMTGFQQKMGLVGVAIAAAATVAVPALLTGATALFAGIATLGLLQSEKIKGVFSTMGNDIKDALAADSAVLGNTALAVAAKVGNAFEGIRPILRDTFATLGPQILDLTDGILGLVTNALPGLSTAAKASGNAIKGVRDFLIDTGKAISDFFSEVAKAGPLAGVSFASLGNILQSIMPLLGKMLAVVSDFSSGAFPVLAAVVGIAADVLGRLLDVIRPIAPVLGIATVAVLGLIVALKTFTLVSAGLAKFDLLARNVGASAGLMTTGLTGSMAAGGRLNSVVTGLGRALPLIGIAAIIVGDQLAQAGKQTDEWSKSLLQGSLSIKGLKADIVTSQVATQVAAQQFPSLITQGQQFINTLNGTAVSSTSLSTALGRTRDAANNYVSSLGPVEAAQAKAKLAQADYNETLRVFGPTSSEAANAQDLLGIATTAVSKAQEDAAKATQDYGAALTELTSQLDGILNKDLAYRDALQSQIALEKTATDAVKQHGTDSVQAKDAFQALGDQYLKTAEAAGAKAAADHAAEGATAAASASSIAYNEELGRLIGTESGPGRRAALGLLASFDDTALGAISAASAASGLKTRVLELPNNRTVTIVADTATAISNLQAARNAIDSIHDRLVTLTTRLTTIVDGGPRAAGGPVEAGRTYLVGEKGPELLTMTGNGFVTPNDKLTQALGATDVTATGGGDGGTIVKVYIDGQEFRGMIRSEVASNERNVRRTVSAGAGAAVA